jgi:hypothetical protein
MLSPLEHEIAPSFASVDQGELALSYLIMADLDPPLGSEKCDNLLFPNQIIKHIRRDDSFLTVGKNNRHTAFLRSTAIVEITNHLPGLILTRCINL